MTLQELRDKIKKEDYIWVQFDDDEAEGIYRATGELVITIDKYHGETGSELERFCEASGIRLHVIHAYDLLGRFLDFEELGVDRTDQVPMGEEIIEVIKGLL
jgi:hypothetical protein